MESGRRLFDFKPKVHFKDRFTTHAKRQIELRKIRTLNEYGHKLDSEKLPYCLCGRPETVKHYIEDIGVGRFRILGGQGLEYWGGGGKGGPNSQQAHDVDATYWRRIDVISTSYAHQVFNTSVPNKYISQLKNPII